MEKSKKLVNVPRRTIQVQMEIRKDLDNRIVERVKELKKAQDWTATFRKMCVLFFALVEDNIEPLFDMFPNLIKKIVERYNDENPPQGSPPGNSDMITTLLTEIADLKTKLQRISEDVQPGAHYQRHAVPSPQNDDDLDHLLNERELTEEEKRKREAERLERGRQATQNFITSLTAMAATKPVKSGPKKMDVPATLPPPTDLDDELLALMQ